MNRRTFIGSLIAIAMLGRLPRAKAVPKPPMWEPAELQRQFAAAGAHNKPIRDARLATMRDTEAFKRWTGFGTAQVVRITSRGTSMIAAYPCPVEPQMHDALFHACTKTQVLLDGLPYDLAENMAQQLRNMGVT